MQYNKMISCIEAIETIQYLITTPLYVFWSRRPDLKQIQNYIKTEFNEQISSFECWLLKL